MFDRFLNKPLRLVQSSRQFFMTDNWNRWSFWLSWLTKVKCDVENVCWLQIFVKQQQIYLKLFQSNFSNMKPRTYMPNDSVVLNTFTSEYSGCILSIQQRRQPLLKQVNILASFFPKCFRGIDTYVWSILYC